MQMDGLAEQEGEGYFASVSDLMVGVLFVFLLMMTVLALNFREDSQTLDEMRRKMEAALATATSLRQQNARIYASLAKAATELKKQLQDREQIRAALLQRMAQQLRAAGISFAIDQQSGVLHLSDAIPFATGSSALTDPGALHTVDVLSHVLARTLPCFAASAARPAGCGADDATILETMLVEGHTDTQQYLNLTARQSEAENDRLSTARALTVFAALREREPALDALKNPAGLPLLGVSGYGQRRPLPGTRNDLDDDLSQNRRIDLRFVLSARNSEELEHLLHEIEAIRPAGGL